MKINFFFQIQEPIQKIYQNNSNFSRVMGLLGESGGGKSLFLIRMIRELNEIYKK